MVTHRPMSRSRNQSLLKQVQGADQVLLDVLTDLEPDLAYGRSEEVARSRTVSPAANPGPVGSPVNVQEVKRRLAEINRAIGVLKHERAGLLRSLSNARDSLDGPASRPIRPGTGASTGSPRDGKAIWRSVTIHYPDGTTRRPGFMGHRAPMAKLAECCGCYRRAWDALMLPYHGRDVTVVIPGSIRRKPRARCAGEDVVVVLEEWR